MKKAAISLLIALVLTLAVMTPALADKGGQPSANASWGQMVKQMAPMDSLMSKNHGAKSGPPAWGKGGIGLNAPWGPNGGGGSD